MNSRRLQPVRTAVALRETRALDEFVKSRSRLAEAEARLAELSGYLESEVPITAPTLTPADLQNRQAFRERVREAARYQRAQIAQIRQACEQARARWALTARDTRVIDELSSCYRMREQQAAERAQQRELDDRHSANPAPNWR